jgi:hypothetical protein
MEAIKSPSFNKIHDLYVAAHPNLSKQGMASIFAEFAAEFTEEVKGQVRNEAAWILTRSWQIQAFARHKFRRGPDVPRTGSEAGKPRRRIRAWSVCVGALRQISQC